MIELTENPNGKRFDDALFIQAGACNPSGVARSLVQAIAEARADGVDARTDPAVRLICHQLAFLCRVEEIDSGSTDVYRKLTADCSAGAAIYAKSVNRKLWRVFEDVASATGGMMVKFVDGFDSQDKAQACVDGQPIDKITQAVFKIIPPVE